jgi:MFS family permease
MSRWRLIALGLIGWSLATGLSGLAGWLHSFWLLIFARCLVGIGEAAYGPAAPAILSDLYPVSKRGQVLAWCYAAIPVGTALGYALGGFLAGFWGWQWAFYLMVPPGLLLGCYCYFLKDPPRGLADADECTEATRAPELRDLLIFARTPSYVLDTLGMTAMCFAIGGIAFWMPTYVYEYYQRTIDQKEVSLIFGGIVVVAGLTSTVLGGLISDWLRPKVSGAYFLVSAVGMLLGLVFFCLVVNAEFPAPFPWVYLFFAVFFLFFNTGPTNTILANVTHPCMRTNAVALNIFIIHLLGDAISPWIIGAVAGLPGCSLRTGFYLMSTMFVLSAGFWVWGMWYLEEDTRLAPRRGLEQG